MHKIKILLLYYFCFSIYSAEPQNDFIESIDERPFYIITITRETPEDADYPQLTQKQQSFIFNVLHRVFGLPNVLDRILREYVDNKRLLLDKYLRFETSHLEALRPLIECTNSSSINVLIEYLKRKGDFSFFFDFLFTTQEGTVKLTQ
jgi:hypothetical protein